MRNATESKERKWADLYKKHGQMVYNASLKGTQSKQAAEDVSQQVFMNVFRHLEGFRNQCQMKTWVYRITLNECYQYRERNRRENRKVQAFLADHPEGKDEAKDWDDKILVGRVLDLADTQTQKMLEMMFYKDLTHEQTAASFGVSRVTITKRLEKFRNSTVAVLGSGEK